MAKRQNAAPQTTAALWKKKVEATTIQLNQVRPIFKTKEGAIMAGVNDTGHLMLYPNVVPTAADYRLFGKWIAETFGGE